MGKTCFHSLSKLYLLTQSSSFLVDHRTTTVALHPTLCRAMFFFCLIPSLPNIFKFFQSCFFSNCAVVSFIHISSLWLYYNMHANQISSYITRINAFFFFILFLLVSYLLFLHFKKNKYWLCALNFFNCLFLLRLCFSLSSCNCLTN